MIVIARPAILHTRTPKKIINMHLKQKNIEIDKSTNLNKILNTVDFITKIRRNSQTINRIPLQIFQNNGNRHFKSHWSVHNINGIYESKSPNLIKVSVAGLSNIYKDVYDKVKTEQYKQNKIKSIIYIPPEKCVTISCKSNQLLGIVYMSAEVLFKCTDIKVLNALVFTFEIP